MHPGTFTWYANTNLRSVRPIFRNALPPLADLVSGWEDYFEQKSETYDGSALSLWIR